MKRVRLPTWWSSLEGEDLKLIKGLKVRVRTMLEGPIKGAEWGTIRGKCCDLVGCDRLVVKLDRVVYHTDFGRLRHVKMMPWNFLADRDVVRAVSLEVQTRKRARRVAEVMMESAGES